MLTRMSAVVFSFFFFFQTVAPAYNAAVTSDLIDELLNHVFPYAYSSNRDQVPGYLSSGSYNYQTSGSYGYQTSGSYDYLFSNSGDDELVQAYLSSGSYSYLFDTEPYIEDSVTDATTIETFIDTLRIENPYRVKESTTTNIIVGTPIVQSRYIRAQLQKLLGRSLIEVEDQDAQSSTRAVPIDTNLEAEQINALYNNALQYLATNPGANFGKILPYHSSHSSGSYSPVDMIWPEAHLIGGKKIILPVVHLSQQTLNRETIKKNVGKLSSGAQVSSLYLEDIELTLGRDAFIHAANNINNIRGVISGEGALSLIAGGNLVNMSGLIQSQDDLSISAHNIYNQTLLYRYTNNNLLFNEEQQFYGQISSIDSADGSVTLRSHNDIVFQGAGSHAAGEIKLIADGSIYLGSQQLYNSYEASGQIDYAGRINRDVDTRTSTISYLQSHLSASDTIELIAAGNILIDAAEIVSDQGHIELLAGMGITIEDDLQQYRSYRQGTFGRTDLEETVYKTVAIRALLDAGKGVRIHSELGDITLRATEINSQEGTSVTAENGALNLLMTTETDHYSYSSVTEGLFTTKTKQKGHNIESGVPNAIVGGLVVEALNGVRIEYEGDRNLTLDEQINKLSQIEEFSWMADVKANTRDVDWSAIELEYEKWNKTKRSISPAFGALISIGVAIATSGAGASFASWVVNPVTTAGASVSAAIAAGTSTFISQASLALANGVVDGDIEQAFEELASNDLLETLGVSMLTAGVINQLDAEFFYLADSAPELSLGQQSIQAVTHATVQAGVQNLVYGGDFEDQLIQSLSQNAVNLIGSNLAKSIGDAYEDGNINNVTRYIAHAATGCLTGSLTVQQIDDADTNSACVHGAGGAVVGEALADMHSISNQLEIKEEHLNEAGVELQTWLAEKLDIDPAELKDDIELQLLMNNDLSLVELMQIKRFKQLHSEFNRLKQNGVNLARLGAGLAAFASGAEAYEVNISSSAGGNAAQNNALWFLLVPAAKMALAAYTLYELHQTIVEVNKMWEEYTHPSTTEARKQELMNELLAMVATEAALSMVPVGKILGKIGESIEKTGIIPQRYFDDIKRELGYESKSFNVDKTFVDPYYEEKYQAYLVRKDRKGELGEARDRADWKKIYDYIMFDSPIARGNKFDSIAGEKYKYNQVQVAGGKRLDSYDPEMGEIVSRKATDLDNIAPETYEKYLKEMRQKYAPGTPITSKKYGPDQVGTVLRGKMYLEIPDFNELSPNYQQYVEIAKKYEIILKPVPEEWP